MRSYNKFVFALSSIFILSRFVFSDYTNIGINNKPRGASSTIFVGITMELPFKEVGKAEASNKKKKVLLDGRVCISKNRIDKLEVKLKAGQVDVTVLAEDILTLAKTEIAIESLKNDDVMQKLSDLGATGQACKAVYICNVKNFGNSA